MPEQALRWSLHRDPLNVSSITLYHAATPNAKICAAVLPARCQAGSQCCRAPGGQEIRVEVPAAHQLTIESLTKTSCSWPVTRGSYAGGCALMVTLGTVLLAHLKPCGQPGARPSQPGHAICSGASNRAICELRILSSHQTWCL